jgi:hypothetical protein
MVVGPVLPAAGPDSVVGREQSLDPRGRIAGEVVRDAVDQVELTRGSYGLVEAEQADHPVDVDCEDGAAGLFPSAAAEHEQAG